MTERTVTHSTFTLEREYAAPVARVFRAFSSIEEKAKWFGDPQSPSQEWELDFTEGGREREAGEFHGKYSAFEAVYHDIVDDERIVFSYTMFYGGEKLSVSLQSIEFIATEEGTRLVLVEHGAYLDGHDNPAAREEGTRGLLEQLAVAVEEPKPMSVE